MGFENPLGERLSFWNGSGAIVGVVEDFHMTFAAQQRAKEIGVRKVLGATVTDLVTLLSKDFVTLVLIAFVAAVPPAYLAAQSWLDDFAYRINIGPVVFIAVGGAVVVVAVLTVSYQSVRAAAADPVKSLRYE